MGVGMGRGTRAAAAWAIVAGLALAGCATPEASAPETPAPAATAPSTPPPASFGADCPATLAFVKPQLVTPPADLEEFIGKAELAETFNQPIDQMIAKDGGIDRSLAGAERTVAEYKKILADSDQVRRDYHAAGQTDHWIDTYLLSVQDGVTINQGFLDATRCRQRKAAASATP